MFKSFMNGLARDEERWTGCRRAPGVFVVVRPPQPPAVLSAVCEWHLTSRLFSPLSTARPTTRARLGPSEGRRRLLLLLLR